MQAVIWESAWTGAAGAGVNRPVGGVWAAHWLEVVVLVLPSLSLSFSPPLSSPNSASLCCLYNSVVKMSMGFGAEIVLTFDKLHNVLLSLAQAPHR